MLTTYDIVCAYNICLSEQILRNVSVGVILVLSTHVRSMTLHQILLPVERKMERTSNFLFGQVGTDWALAIVHVSLHINCPAFSLSWIIRNGVLIPHHDQRPESDPDKYWTFCIVFFINYSLFYSYEILNHTEPLAHICTSPDLLRSWSQEVCREREQGPLWKKASSINKEDPDLCIELCTFLKFISFLSPSRLIFHV